VAPFFSKPHGIETRITFGPSAPQQSIRNQPTHKGGRAGPVNAGCCHNAGLADTIRFGNRLEHRKLTRRELAAYMVREQAVRPLAGAMQ